MLMLRPQFFTMQLCVSKLLREHYIQLHTHLQASKLLTLA